MNIFTAIVLGLMAILAVVILVVNGLNRDTLIGMGIIGLIVVGAVVISIRRQKD